MSQSKVMAAKQAKANRCRIQAVKWFSYTSSMVEIRHGEASVCNPPLVEYCVNKKMYNYRIVVNGNKVLRRTTSKTVDELRADFQNSKYKSVFVVEIDGKDVYINLFSN